MTPDDIKRLRALCEQATQPGPWTVNVNDIGKDGDGHCVVLDAHGMWVADCGNAPADAAFIAAARSALPQLLDECESLRRERDRYAWATPAANVTRPAGCRCDLWPRGYCRDGCPSSDTTRDRLSARVAELERLLGEALTIARQHSEACGHVGNRESSLAGLAEIENEAKS